MNVSVKFISFGSQTDPGDQQAAFADIYNKKNQKSIYHTDKKYFKILPVASNFVSR